MRVTLSIKNLPLIPYLFGLQCYSEPVTFKPAYQKVSCITHTRLWYVPPKLDVKCEKKTKRCSYVYLYMHQRNEEIFNQDFRKVINMHVLIIYVLLYVMIHNKWFNWLIIVQSFNCCKFNIVKKRMYDIPGISSLLNHKNDQCIFNSFFIKQ